jgi:hypothetical protein
MVLAIDERGRDRDRRRSVEFASDQAQPDPGSCVHMMAADHARSLLTVLVLT